MHVRSLMITLFVKIGSGMSDLKVNRSWETRVSKKCVSFLWNPHVSDLAPRLRATRDKDDLLLYIYLSDLRGNLRHQLFQEQFPYDFQSCRSPPCCRTHRWVWRQHLSSSHLVARRFRLHVHQRHQRSPLRWKQNPWLLWRWRLNKPSCARIRWDFEFEFSFTRTSASDCGLFWECGPSGACLMECPICFTNPITCPVGRLEFDCRFKHLDCISKWEFFPSRSSVCDFSHLVDCNNCKEECESNNCSEGWDCDRTTDCKCSDCKSDSDCASGQQCCDRKCASNCGMYRNTLAKKSN